tara:strand:+ start:664 stop:1248 length:585 start_codon:yes stop_codon:yes gene_type:complete
MAYFRYFPTIAYDVRGIENDEQFDLITNLLSRVLIKCHGWADIDNSSYEALVGISHYEKYIIKDGDRPDTLADKLYGDSELHWLIMYANGTSISNPWYDWPMIQSTLTKFITKKYGSANIYATHHYEDTNEYTVDSTDQPGAVAEISTTAPNATAVTNFVYEERINDSKRVIRLMHRQYIDLVIDEFQSLLEEN